ncbi:MAG: outer membrane beta-barrel protein [Saprospiraceae bacterium]|nr:outer membrane beta-barrel protein [Saprospiraceae bacterium]MCF8251526.1 outer membrane beta-barrel protein [Saprospiraceae bacterium]MCF8280856.1 outer membrane beta-barrel protein [Bacteroidales bacterium]MCF8310964.1 outer membrane beta-barrel protein [Saprospiraceae bacterium]MCF8439700.1 outer membrane beta-barrel protein [Saprospiraceae bacterium]
MKNFTIFLLITLPIIVFGQKNANLEITSSLNFTDYSNKIGKTEGRLNYDFGMAMSLPTKHSNREWVLGLRFMAYGDKSKSGGLRWGSQHDGMGGFDPNAPSLENVSGFESKSNLFYVEVPVAYRLYLLNGRTRLFVQANAGPSIYLTYRNANTTSYGDGTSQTYVQTGYDDNFRKLNAVAGLSMGIEIPVSDKLGIQLQPHGQMQLLSIASNSETGAKWYAFGLRTGLRYRLF